MFLDIASTSKRTIIDFRKLGFVCAQVLGKYNYTKTEKPLSDHQHENMIEICYCDKGKQNFHVGGTPYLVSGGEIFINYPNEIHGSGKHDESKGALYWLIINLDSHDQLNEIIYLCLQLIKKKVRHFKGNGKQKQILDMIFKTYDNSQHDTIQKIRIATLLKNFLISLFDCIDNFKQEIEDMRLKEIMDYIDNNLTENLTIPDLADKMNLSASRFKILFKEISGFTPNDYVQRKRIHKALEILQMQNDLSLNTLAYQFNFSSPQYFSTVVKKYTGKSPSEFRESNKPQSIP